MPLKAAPGRVFRATLRPAFVGARDGVVRMLERRNGISTAGVVELDELGLAGPDRMRYKPAPWLLLRRALPKRSVSRDDVFIDFGSGMGRVVFQAALHFPFRRVLGVELSPELHRIAQGNIDRNRSRFRAQQVDLVRSDVLDFDIPDDVSVVFFDNPFTGRIFTEVVDRLLASVDRAPRRLRIIYFNPVEHEWLMGTGRIEVIRRVRGLRPGADWARSNSANVYAVQPGRPAAN
ncbi:MAG TPA: methyltransferase domain-containing protein [Micromonosporaceae bacterium]|nr:methyltransferase domain-containing protein [Micromonosporaceae bacterium]